MKKNFFESLFFLIVYCIVVFALSLIFISKIMNQGNVDMTTTMSDATFPTMCFVSGDKDFNLLHGYSSKMDATHIRGNITPVGMDRKLKFKINTYDSTVSNISFELRSTDGTRLVEESEVYDYIRNKDSITGTINLKDLIYDHVEYSLCVNVETSRGQSIYFYTNLIEADDYALQEKLDFVFNFSDATFDKERAENEITTYVESNAEGDNTTFNKVNIHSSLSQITWGELNPKRITNPVASISQIDQDIAVININYFVSVDDNKEYRVDEMYRIRLGEERMFLLDYEREMEQIFIADTDKIAGNKIELGIVNSNINMNESADGKRIAFENDGRLFSYNVTENKLAYIYGFYETAEDERNLYNEHAIKIFSIDEKGNIYFMIYGYMNRGNHEGDSGCMIAYYDSEKNYVEELAFVPSNQDYDTVCREVKDLSYIGASDLFYLLMGSHVYSVDLSNNKVTDIAKFKDDKSYVVSRDSNEVAWVLDGCNKSTELYFMDMSDDASYTISAPDGDYIKPVGFFGDDLIYGLAHKSDITTDVSGKEVFPLYVIYIIDKNLNTIKTYDADGMYVTDCRADGDYLINLTRMKKDASGKVSIEASDDQLIDNISASSMKNGINVVAIEKYEKIVEIVFNKEVDSDKTQILTPKQVLFEGDRDVVIDRESFPDSYYVYVKGSFSGVYSELSDAANYAYLQGGCVYDESGRIIYQKTTLPKKNQIMAITGTAIRENESETVSLAVCLNSILEFEGVTKDTRKDVQRGVNPSKILEDNLENITVLDYSGCELEIVLSQVAKDIPVLVELDDGRYFLIIGYNEFNTVVMNPITGTVYKIGMNDSKTLFGSCGNRFTSYRRNEY